MNAGELRGLFLGEEVVEGHAADVCELLHGVCARQERVDPSHVVVAAAVGVVVEAFEEDEVVLVSPQRRGLLRPRICDACQGVVCVASSAWETELVEGARVAQVAPVLTRPDAPPCGVVDADEALVGSFGLCGRADTAMKHARSRGASKS